MRTRTLTLALLLVASLVVTTSPAATAAPESTFTTDFSDGVDVFNSSAWGMEELRDGHVGEGLRTIIPAGQHWGASGHYEFAQRSGSEPDELYWRYWLKFDDGFYIEPPNRGKLPGVGGLYNYRCLGGRKSTTAEPCFSARMLFSREYPRAGQPGYPNGPADKTLIGFYAYHLDSPSNRGDIWGWDRDVALLDHGRWYCVEGRIAMNTPGVRDGVLQGWVDGQPAFDRDDLAFRRSNEAWMHVKSFWFDVYYGGSSSAVRNEIHFDSLSFGPERQGCDDADRFTPPFRDDDGTTFEADIAWLADSGITRGCASDRFCPDAPVTRGQMAAFLSRALDLPAAPSGDRFRDDDTSMFEGDIERLAASGITRGCDPPANTRFCPDAPVTRGQMAAFLVRALGLSATDGSSFVDDDRSVFERDIERLAAAGITRGCNPPSNSRFCPDAPVTRGQMAAFLARALRG